MKIQFKNKAVFVSMLLIVSLLLNWNCAKIVPLTGGDKDSKPPIILKSSPDTFSTSFSSKTIQINFNEYVNLKSPSTEIFYSPPFKTQPEVIGKGKSIVIKLKDTLQANTTYSIRFGNAVADITEGNVAKNLEYVFSTGAYIDSGKVQGNIINAFDLSASKDMKVMLYELPNDSFPYIRRPLYYGITDESGSFSINYLKKGNYLLFAIEEQNNNFLYDRPGEKIAFSEVLISTDSSQLIRLKSFTEIPKAYKLIKAKSPFYGKILFEFSGSAEGVQIIPQSNAEVFADSLFESNETGDSLIVWYKKGLQDSAGFYLAKNNTVFDTVMVKIPKLSEKIDSLQKGNQGSRGLKKETVSEKFSFSTNFTGSKAYNLYSDLKITFSHPVGEIDTSKFHLLKEFNVIPFSYKFADKSRRVMVLTSKLQEGSQYSFIALKGAFNSFLGRNSDTLNTTFITKTDKEFGNLELRVTNPEMNCGVILLLLKPNAEILRKQYFKKGEEITATFNKLEAGEYKIRLIYDANNNGKWDTGNYLEKIQPEKVILMSAPAVIRQSWDQNLKWDLQEKGKDNKKAIGK